MFVCHATYERIRNAENSKIYITPLVFDYGTWGRRAQFAYTETSTWIQSTWAFQLIELRWLNFHPIFMILPVPTTKFIPLPWKNAILLHWLRARLQVPSRSRRDLDGTCFLLNFLKSAEAKFPTFALFWSEYGHTRPSVLDQIFF